MIIKDEIRYLKKEIREMENRNFNTIKSSNHLKKLKSTYLNWIKNEIENDFENYYSITLHLNPFNKFNIQKQLTIMDSKDESKKYLSRENLNYGVWRNMRDEGKFYEWGSKVKYSRCLRKFLNKLNDEIFGNNWNRRNQGIEFVVSFFESKDSKLNKNLINPHYHLIIKKPSHISELKFRSLVIRLWGFWRFKFNKKYKNKSGESWFEDSDGIIRGKSVGGVFDHINIQRFYRKSNGYDFIDYGLKDYEKDINKVDVYNFRIKGI